MRVFPRPFYPHPQLNQAARQRNNNNNMDLRKIAVPHVNTPVTRIRGQATVVNDVHNGWKLSFYRSISRNPLTGQTRLFSRRPKTNER